MKTKNLNVDYKKLVALTKEFLSMKQRLQCFLKKLKD